ncbi:hypothetical protein [Rhodocyclus tenuis]|uniref:hypothetical protein n=1 Tax=Rhodocyclus tenuis TaxID=1066 RepID=UPI001908946A|nr:hypothetical protein [Rhodocyclus tenuis]MBK1680756.1 hypothetical protein [Rhodocyclus tenuis]
MNNASKGTRKVSVLISKIEDDCRINISTLIRDGREAAALWAVNWDSPVWDVSHIFAQTIRSHRSERKALKFWFTERRESPRVPGQAFEKIFGEVVRSLVVLRHQVGNQCFVDQQQVIIAAQFISQQLASRNHDLTTLTTGDLEAACDQIAATQAESTAYKLQRFVEVIAAAIDQNRLCPRRLDFRYAKKVRPASVGGLDYVRLDDPDLARGASAKLISDDVLKALGFLYQTIPDNQTSDRLLINAVVIAACTGRRIGEILTLPVQRIAYDRKGDAYIQYYKEKRSEGCQIVHLEKLYLIPQTIPLMEAALGEAIELTRECRATAKHISNTGAADTRGLADTHHVTLRDLQSFLELPNVRIRAWLKTRNIVPAREMQKKNVFLRADIVSALQKEIFSGPAVHVTPPGKDLALEDMIFIAFKHAFHSQKATFRYAVWPVNVRNLGDFLGARGTGVFKRYFSGQEEADFRINSHRFRHTLNTILQRGGMSDALQTEWFARKNPSDTRAYQHMTAAEKAHAAHRATANRFDTQPPPLKLFQRQEAIAAAAQRAVLDLGLGYCQHDWRNRPCARYTEISLGPDALVWDGLAPSQRASELDRIGQFIQLMLNNARRRADCGDEEASKWVNLYQQMAAEVELLMKSLKNGPSDT